MGYLLTLVPFKHCETCLQGVAQSPKSFSTLYVTIFTGVTLVPL